MLQSASSFLRPAIVFSVLLAALATVYSYSAEIGSQDSEWRELLLPITMRIAEVSPPWLSALLGLEDEYDELESDNTLSTYKCPELNYTMEIVSIDPLLIYINNFISPQESQELLKLGNSSFKPSHVDRYGQKQKAQTRTSDSAALPRTHPVTSCILARSKAFMGTMLGGDDDFSMPQLVRYRRGQKFDLHSDWYDRPQLVDVETVAKDGQKITEERHWNRIASFFVFVKNRGVRGGETYFPHIKGSNLHGLDPLSTAIVMQNEKEYKGKPKNKGGVEKVREHEKGGLAFKPIEGNALFWVNLMPDGTGDKRVLHAGLPLESGSKVGMNIWPRKFYPQT